MDVDGGALNSQQADLEQSLLQEFSRMGTTDKDELINQMQKLLGPSLNYNTASFFLDMNNWNIQEATCCYLDFQPSNAPSTTVMGPLPLPLPPPPPPPYQMSLVFAKPAPIPDPHPPGFSVAWTWMVRNSGTDAWPEGCYVRPVDSTGSVVDVPKAVQPGMLYVLSFFPPPPHSGVPHSQLYRLYTPQGQPFGDDLWVNVVVDSHQQTGVQSMDDSTVDENTFFT